VSFITREKTVQLLSGHGLTTTNWRTRMSDELFQNLVILKLKAEILLEVLNVTFVEELCFVAVNLLR